jgi:hypothetical protein
VFLGRLSANGATSQSVSRDCNQPCFADARGKASLTPFAHLVIFRPEGAKQYSPGNALGVGAARNGESPERAKHTILVCIVTPLQGLKSTTTSPTQGVALGFIVVPFQGEGRRRRVGLIPERPLRGRGVVFDANPGLPSPAARFDLGYKKRPYRPRTHAMSSSKERNFKTDASGWDCDRLLMQFP